MLLLSLAFMATGGFLGLHALGTQQVLFTKEYAGFMVAIPVGLLVSAVFALASAFVDTRPALAATLIRRRSLLRVRSWICRRSAAKAERPRRER